MGRENGYDAWLLPKLLAGRRGAPAPQRIDGLMVASLSFILWFALVPLIGMALGTEAEEATAKALSPVGPCCTCEEVGDGRLWSLR